MLKRKIKTEKLWCFAFGLNMNGLIRVARGYILKGTKESQVETEAGS